MRDPERAFGRSAIAGAAQFEFQQTEHGVHRRADLVAHRREKRRFRAVGGLRLFLGRAHRHFRRDPARDLRAQRDGPGHQQQHDPKAERRAQFDLRAAPLPERLRMLAERPAAADRIEFSGMQLTDRAVDDAGERRLAPRHHQAVRHRFAAERAALHEPSAIRVRHRVVRERHVGDGGIGAAIRERIELGVVVRRPDDSRRRHALAHE